MKKNGVLEAILKVAFSNMLPLFHQNPSIQGQNNSRCQTEIQLE